MVKCEIARMVQQGGTSRRGSKEHCPADLARKVRTIIVTDTRLRTTFGGLFWARRRQQPQEEAVQLVVCRVWLQDWRNPSRILVIQDCTDRREATVFRAHAAPHGVCGNLVNALQLLANQQQGGDSLVEVPVEGLQERSRLKIMEGSRKFIMMEGHRKPCRIRATVMLHRTFGWFVLYFSGVRTTDYTDYWLLHCLRAAGASGYLCVWVTQHSLSRESTGMCCALPTCVHGVAKPNHERERKSPLGFFSG